MKSIHLIVAVLATFALCAASQEDAIRRILSRNERSDHGFPYRGTPGGWESRNGVESYGWDSRRPLSPGPNSGHGPAPSPGASPAPSPTIGASPCSRCAGAGANDGYRGNGYDNLSPEWYDKQGAKEWNQGSVWQGSVKPIPGAWDPKYEAPYPPSQSPGWGGGWYEERRPVGGGGAAANWVDGPSRWDTYERKDYGGGGGPGYRPGYETGSYGGAGPRDPSYGAVGSGYGGAALAYGNAGSGYGGGNPGYGGGGSGYGGASPSYAGGASPSYGGGASPGYGGGASPSYGGGANPSYGGGGSPGYGGGSSWYGNSGVNVGNSGPQGAGYPSQGNGYSYEPKPFPGYQQPHGPESSQWDSRYRPQTPSWDPYWHYYGPSYGMYGGSREGVYGSYGGRPYEGGIGLNRPQYYEGTSYSTGSYGGPAYGTNPWSYASDYGYGQPPYYGGGKPPSKLPPVGGRPEEWNYGDRYAPGAGGGSWSRPGSDGYVPIGGGGGGPSYPPSAEPPYQPGGGYRPGEPWTRPGGSQIGVWTRPNEEAYRPNDIYRPGSESWGRPGDGPLRPGNERWDGGYRPGGSWQEKPEYRPPCSSCSTYTSGGVYRPVGDDNHKPGGYDHQSSGGYDRPGGSSSNQSGGSKYRPLGGYDRGHEEHSNSHHDNGPSSQDSAGQNGGSKGLDRYPGHTGVGATYDFGNSADTSRRGEGGVYYYDRPSSSTPQAVSTTLRPTVSPAEESSTPS